MIFFSLDRDNEKNVQFIRREITTYRQTRIGQFRWRVGTVRSIDSAYRAFRNLFNRLDTLRYLTDDSLNGDSDNLVISQLKSCLVSHRTAEYVDSVSRM